MFGTLNDSKLLATYLIVFVNKKKNKTKNKQTNKQTKKTKKKQNPKHYIDEGRDSSKKS